MIAKKRVLIFTGGELHPSYIKEITDDDFIIGADRGALYLVEHNVTPDIAVGDFDSVTSQEMDHILSYSKEVITCDAVNKDLTDTELAMDMAINCSPNEIILIGALGTRLDHSLANVHMLLRGIEHHISTSILDTNNYVTLTDSTYKVHDRGYTYVSLLPLTPIVTGINLKGFMYPLHNAVLKIGQSLGVSNRLLDKEGLVTIDSGLLLIIQSKD